MDSDASSVLRESRRLREHGRYAEAVNTLQATLKRGGPALELAVELGETLLVQGYYNRAMAVLEDNLAGSNGLWSVDIAAGKLISCMAQVFCTGRLRQSLDLADKTYSTFISSKESESFNDATVRIESYYFRLWKLASIQGGLDISHVLSISSRRLKAAFDVMLQRKEFANALRMAQTYYNCQDGLDSCLLVKTLAGNQTVPALYQAQALVSLAKKVSNKEEQDQLYATAVQFFEDANHAHGPLDIAIFQLSQTPLDPNIKDIEHRINELFQKYKLLDYPAGLNSAYLDLHGLAQRFHNFELQISIQNEIESLALASGSKFIWTMTRISTLAHWSLAGADNAKVVSGATSLWESLVDSDFTILRGQAADIASRAYSALKDSEIAAEWSIRAQQDLPVSNRIAVISLAKDFDLTDHEHMEEFYKKVVQLVQQNLAMESVDDAVEKLDVFIDHVLAHLSLAPASLDLIENAIEWAKNLGQGLKSQEDMWATLARLFKSEGSLQIKRAAFRKDVEAENAAIDAFNQSKNYYLKAKRIHEAASVLQNLGLTHFGCFQKFDKIRHPDGQVALDTALKLFEIALDSFNVMSSVFQISESTYWVGLCKYEQWQKNRCSSDDLLATLVSAERFTDKRRHEVSILEGVQAITTKQRISSDKHVRDIYRFAIQVCRSNAHWNEAWKWVQKSKARSLSDTLGLGVLVPQKLVDEIQSQETTRRLYEEEQKLLKDIYKSLRTEIFQERIKLERHQEEMRKHDSLKKLLNLREGVPTTLHDLREATASGERAWKRRPVIFVDWVVTQYSVLMSIVKRDGETVFRTLAISLSTLQEWIKDNLNSKTHTNDNGNAFSGIMEDDEPNGSPLRQLDALIQPLGEFSNRDDLLVFCPSGLLNSLPLHALRLGPSGEGEILIIRNPIVYCASLTSYSQCCLRANSAPSSIDISATKSFLAVYEPPFTADQMDDFDQTEQDQIYSSMDTIAMRLNGKAFCGSNVTHKVLRECLEDSQFVHFHGHCDLNSGLVTEQSLRLSNQGGSEAHLAVKDLFDLRIHSSHISLLACGSALQQFEAGDEPLGLVTAFLSAGASSVLGTMWPVQSKTAREFSKNFYSYLQEAGDNEYNVIDLAYAMREAVADTMQLWELRQPYHWAPFVLHGAWFFNGQI